MKFNKEELEAIVMAEECEQFDEKCIVCILTLENGYKVSGLYVHTGDGFIDNAYGEKIAREQALNKVYELESYLEQQKFYEAEKKSVIEEAEKTIDDNIYTSGKFSDTLIHYYCPDCGKTYEERVCENIRTTSDRVSFGSNTWYKCDCGSDAFEVDAGMIPVIAKLNKIGFRTEFCCEGHDFGEAAYICFDTRVSLENIEMPHMWIRDKSKMVTVVDTDRPDDITIIERECIRVDMYNNPDRASKIYNNDFDRYKNMYLNSLYIWVDELETKILEEKEYEKELQAKLAACQSSSKDYSLGITTTTSSAGIQPLDVHYDHSGSIINSEKELKRLMEDKNYDGNPAIGMSNGSRCAIDYQVKG